MTDDKRVIPISELLSGQTLHTAEQKPLPQVEAPQPIPRTAVGSQAQGSSVDAGLSAEPKSAPAESKSVSAKPIEDVAAPEPKKSVKEGEAPAREAAPHPARAESAEPASQPAPSQDFLEPPRVTLRPPLDEETAARTDAPVPGLEMMPEEPEDAGAAKEMDAQAKRSEPAAAETEAAAGTEAGAEKAAPDPQVPYDAPTERTKPVVLIKGLKKKIGRQTVLEDLDLAVFNGHVLGLLGPNGAGKTTLLRILAGLAHPTEGRVEIDGMTPGVETKKIVSYLPDGSFLPESMTTAGARHHFATFFPDFDQARFDALAERLKLPQHTRIGKMSKGYRDRLAICLVMSRRARLYLLDEPLGGVDPVVRDEVLDILVEAMGEDATMLITTHQVRDLERIFDEVCFLKEGRAVSYGAADVVRDEAGADLDTVYRKIFGQV